MVVGDCTSGSKNNQKVLFLLNLYRGHFHTANTSFHILFSLRYLKITIPVFPNSISPHTVQVGPHYTWHLEVNRWPRMRVKITEESKEWNIGPITNKYLNVIFPVFWAHCAHSCLFLLPVDTALCPTRSFARVQRRDEMSPVVMIFSSFILLYQSLSKTSPKRQRQANPKYEYSADTNPKGGPVSVRSSVSTHKLALTIGLGDMGLVRHEKR